VLLDHHGNVRLTDFGLSKENISSIDSGAHSFCGTPEYLAPEVLNRAGHGYAVDWWSLGALLYEMLTGLPPFYCRDRTVLFEKIKKGTLEFPEYLSPDAKDILKGLLNRDPAKRLGCGPGDATEIKSHPFFAPIDWNALLMCRVPPPWVPTVSGSMDTSQFDAEFTSMPIVSPSSQREPQLSSHVARTAFEGFTYVAPSTVTPGGQPQLHAGATGGTADATSGDAGSMRSHLGGGARGMHGSSGYAGAADDTMGSDGGDDSAGGIGLSLDAPLPPLPGAGSRLVAERALGRPPSAHTLAAAQQAAYLHAQQAAQQAQQQAAAVAAAQWQQQMAMAQQQAQQQQLLQQQQLQQQQQGYGDVSAAAGALDSLDPAAAHMALLHQYQQAHAHLQAQAEAAAAVHAARAATGATGLHADHGMSIDEGGAAQ
jgi:hypothetical protein